MNTSTGVFAGLAGVTLDVPEVTLGYGVKLTSTYAHLMAPFMMAFSPAPKGSHHPAPWVAVKGGLGFDMTVQIEVPPSTVTALSLEPTYVLEATDQCMFARHRSLALLWLWGGLEAIFSPDKAELRYRISSAIASFLEPSGVPRMNAQKSIAKLYDSRSAAAHGREDKKADSLQDTYALARRAVLKMIEDNRVPSHTELEAKLFGADPG